MSILHICSDYNILAKTIYYAINIISTEVELFTIRCRINQVVDAIYIIVITDAIDLTHYLILIVYCYSTEFQGILQQELLQFY